MPEEVKTDWQQVVDNSKGKSFFAPEKYIEQIKEWEALRKKLSEQTEAAAETEVKTQVALQNMFLSLRNYAVETGIKAPWSKDIGFDTSALREGVYIVNITDPIS